MADFIRELADEAGWTSVKTSVRLRSPGENNDSINAQIRRKSGRGSGALDPGNLNAHIRSGAGRLHVGSTGGPGPSIDKALADQISQATLEGGGSNGI